MAEYCFVTTWLLEAPIDRVWAEIINCDRWPVWWPAVEKVEELTSSAAEATGNIWRFTWKTPLVYKLKFNIITARKKAPELLCIIAIGDLNGVGSWRLKSLAESTLVIYTWQVNIANPWMELVALLLRPLVEWNHHTIMRQGGKKLAELLQTRLILCEIK